MAEKEGFYPFATSENSSQTMLLDIFCVAAAANLLALSPTGCARSRDPRGRSGSNLNSA